MTLHIFLLHLHVHIVSYCYRIQAHIACVTQKILFGSGLICFCLGCLVATSRSGNKCRQRPVAPIARQVMLSSILLTFVCESSGRDGEIREQWWMQCGNAAVRHTIIWLDAKFRKSRRFNEMCVPSGGDFLRRW